MVFGLGINIVYSRGLVIGIAHNSCNTVVLGDAAVIQRHAAVGGKTVLSRAYRIEHSLR